MIVLIMGPMFSGKTTELIRQLERAHIANKRVVLLRPKLDTRPFLSHSTKETKWLEEQFVDLSEFNATKYDVIGIDEGQFHKGLKSFCKKYGLTGKKIVVSADCPAGRRAASYWPGPAGCRSARDSPENQPPVGRSFLIFHSTQR